MKVYVDSGVLVKLYVREINSAAAAAAVGCHQTVGFNSLQELEIRNALRALEGRACITPAQRAAAEHYLEVDCIEGRLHRAAVSWTEVFQLALDLGRSHTAETLARSLDILHVAAALHDRCTELITADLRQQEFARRCGLRVTFIAA